MATEMEIPVIPQVRMMVVVQILEEKTAAHRQVVGRVQDQTEVQARAKRGHPKIYVQVVTILVGAKTLLKMNH
jgi:hypothetical protein